MDVDWEHILRQAGPAVWRTACRLLGSRDDADDCVQDAFAAAVQIARQQSVQNWRALLQRLVTARKSGKRPTVRKGVTDYWRGIGIVNDPAAIEVTRIESAVADYPGIAEWRCWRGRWLGFWARQIIQHRITVVVDDHNVCLGR